MVKLGADDMQTYFAQNGPLEISPRQASLERCPGKGRPISLLCPEWHGKFCQADIIKREANCGETI
jgi:hypothetical protein